MRIGVVIPYYQREAGILARALRSIFLQDLPAGASVEVVIVNDASPAPVEPELDVLTREQKAAVTVLSQPNGGPGAARNRGLDHLAEADVDYVAFLDSDDTWTSRHLIEATDALSRGFGFYLCANRRTSGDVTSPDGGDEELARLRRPDEPGVSWLAPNASLIAVESDRLLRAYVAAYIGQTSTIVVTIDAVRHLRFNPDLRKAGEDQLFWIELALSGQRAVISSAVNVTCGRGVNIYYSAFDFGSTKVVERVGYVLLFWRQVKARLAAHGLSDPNCERGLTRYRRAYSYLFLRSLLRRQAPSLELLRILVTQEPSLAFSMPFRFLSVLRHRHRETSTW